jgi:uncharacterized membrane protein YgcG
VAPLLSIPLFGVVVFGGSIRRYRNKLALLMICLLILLFAACNLQNQASSSTSGGNGSGGSSGGSTSSVIGYYNISLLATSGGLQKSTVVQITFQ